MNRAADWLRQAERDLEVARRLAAGGYHEWAAFVSQQSAGKAAKALAQAKSGSVRGHSITAILDGLRSAVSVPSGLLDAARDLDQVYVTSRYPSGFASGSPADYFSQATSERLIPHAETIVTFCRGQIS